MAFEKDTVTKIAKLARLRISDAERDALFADLSGILSFVAKLDKVNTDGVEPMTAVVDMGLRQRADDVTDGGYPERVLANGPETQMDFFTVPKVVE